MEPPPAPAKAKKQYDTIAVAQLPKKPDFSRTIAHPHTPDAEQSATKDVDQEPGKENSIDPPMTAPTNANDQLMKAIEMLKTMHMSGENLTTKNAVVAILEDLTATDQLLTFSPPPLQKSVEDQRITNVKNDMKEIKETMYEMKAMLAANKPLWSTIM